MLNASGKILQKLCTLNLRAHFAVLLFVLKQITNAAYSYSVISMLQNVNCTHTGTIGFVVSPSELMRNLSSVFCESVGLTLHENIVFLLQQHLKQSCRYFSFSISLHFTLNCILCLYFYICALHLLVSLKLLSREGLHNVFLSQLQLR